MIHNGPDEVSNVEARRLSCDSYKNTYAPNNLVDSRRDKWGAEAERGGISCIFNYGGVYCSTERT